jgi:hypothetical protein
MKRGALTALAVLGLAASGAATACDPPAGVSDIPDGKTATREAMVAAQKAVVAYDAAVKAYSACLQDEQKRKLAAGGDRTRLESEYSRLQNDEVVKLEKAAQRFNSELREFKARNAG